MELIDNVNKILRDDLATEIHEGSRLSIAAACFLIYAYSEFKKGLESIDELRFIFTSPIYNAIFDYINQTIGDIDYQSHSIQIE